VIGRLWSVCDDTIACPLTGLGDFLLITYSFLMSSQFNRVDTAPVNFLVSFLLVVESAAATSRSCNVRDTGAGEMLLGSAAIGVEIVARGSGIGSGSVLDIRGGTSGCTSEIVADANSCWIKPAVATLGCPRAGRLDTEIVEAVVGVTSATPSTCTCTLGSTLTSTLVVVAVVGILDSATTGALVVEAADSVSNVVPEKDGRPTILNGSSSDSFIGDVATFAPNLVFSTCPAAELSSEPTEAVEDSSVSDSDS
jgi:hypothetical protein